MIKKIVDYFLNKENKSIKTTKKVYFCNVLLYSTEYTSNYPADIKNISTSDEEKEQNISKIGFKK